MLPLRSVVVTTTVVVRLAVDFQNKLYIFGMKMELAQEISFFPQQEISVENKRR